MSDTRRAIAERLLNEHRYFSSVDTLLAGTRDVEKCMSEYAAALLEEAARLFAPDDHSAHTKCYGYEVRLWLEQRAAQERGR